VSSLRHRLSYSTAGARLRLSRVWGTHGRFAVGALLLAAAALVVVAQPWAAPSRAGAPPSAAVSVAASSLAPTESTGESASASAGTAAPTLAASPTPLPISELTGYVWPLANAWITLPFEKTDWGDFMVDGQRFHDGVDMATFCGDKILAAHDGVVLAAGRHFDDYLGWQGDLSAYYARLDAKHLWDYLPIMIVIDDGNGYRSLYAHMYLLTVNVGDWVTAGQVIGYEGMTGNATGCHLHYGLFSPLEKATMGVDPGVVARMLLPTTETARVNPLLILPFRCDVVETRSLRPAEAAACPAATPSPSLRPSPSPSPSPSHSPSPSPSHSQSSSTHAPPTATPTAAPTAPPAEATPSSAPTDSPQPSSGEEPSGSG
jgi:murein DD-endopeptidase MepM/ murein hydrolase activator NlpD